MMKLGLHIKLPWIWKPPTNKKIKLFILLFTTERKDILTLKKVREVAQIVCNRGSGERKSNLDKVQKKQPQDLRSL